MDPLTIALLSGGASMLGGFLNRQPDPLEAYRRAGFLTYGQDTPTGFANSAYGQWTGSPAYAALQNSLFGQQTGFQNQLQGSLANRGLLNSGLGNIIGSLGGSLYGGNLAQAQGSQYQNFLQMAPQMFALRQQLAGLGTPTTGRQALGAGLQGLGNFGLNYLTMRNVGQPQQMQAQPTLGYGAMTQPGVGATPAHYGYNVPSMPQPYRPYKQGMVPPR